MLAGETSPSSESFVRNLFDESWELDAIIDSDGEEHEPGGGGVDMAPLHLPVRHLLQETRLRHGRARSEEFRCLKCYFGTFTPDTMARHLVDHHDLVKPTAADGVLDVERYGYPVRECMQS